MKRCYIYILIAVLLVSACFKEQGSSMSEISAPAGKGLVIFAESTPFSKADIDKGKSVWEYGDSIAVIYDGKVYIYKTLQSGEQALFTCANGIEEYDNSKRLIAYYPTVSHDEAIGIPANQEISFCGDDQINAAKAPLVGETDGEISHDGSLRMSFKNICSVLELRLDPEALSEGIKSIKIEPASMTGYEGYLSFTGTVNPETLAITAQSTGNTITMTLPENTSLGRPLTLKIPIGRFISPSGLKITAESLDGRGVSRVVYGTGIESYTEVDGTYSVKHFAKPLFPFVFTPPETVDLGLSVLWASCNLGATAPEEFGDYYAWGETETKSDYSWSTYKFATSETGPFSKYNIDSGYGPVDNKTVLEPEDDAAYARLGKQWRTPTEEEWTELQDNCSWTWTTINDIPGRKVTSNIAGYTDKWIFLPSAGYMDETSVKSSSAGYYWSSTLRTDGETGPTHGRRILEKEGSVTMGQAQRYYGMSVRPVYGDKSNIPVASVEIAPSSVLVEIGKTATLAATFRPADATNQLITWNSADQSVATVDESGKVTGIAEGTTSVTAICGDRSATCLVMVKQAMPTDLVDLGLGVKWGSCNIGASSPEEYGGYYAWGETSTKSEYSWSNYKWGTSKTTLTKYNTNSSNGTVDNLTLLQMSDDAAHAALGGFWRMPTDVEWTELRENCKWLWVNYNGTPGMVVTGEKAGCAGNWIFLPAAGSPQWISSQGFRGYYRTSSLDPDNPGQSWGLRLTSEDIYMASYNRYFGFSVRPVYGEIPVSSISVAPATMTLNVNASQTLTANVQPSNATNPSLTWSSSNTSVATVNSSGKVTAVAAGTATITATAKDGSGKKASCAVTVKVPTGAVDLGLSVFWATCNLGTSGFVSSPEKYGEYYAWGETATKTNYSWSTYKWCKGSDTTLTKYNTSSSYGTVDNKTVLDPADDVAHVKLGGNWRMPTDAEWTELRTKCTWTWTTNYNGTGVKGRIVAASNGNSIFLPATGGRWDAYLYNVGSYGDYWSSSLNTGLPYGAWRVYFNSGGVSRDDLERYYGRSVRPVSE